MPYPREKPPRPDKDAVKELARVMMAAAKSPIHDAIRRKLEELGPIDPATLPPVRKQDIHTLGSIARLLRPWRPFSGATILSWIRERGLPAIEVDHKLGWLVDEEKLEVWWEEFKAERRLLAYLRGVRLSDINIAERERLLAYVREKKGKLSMDELYEECQRSLTRNAWQGFLRQERIRMRRNDPARRNAVEVEREARKKERRRADIEAARRELAERRGIFGAREVSDVVDRRDDAAEGGEGEDDEDEREGW